MFDDLISEEDRKAIDDHSKGMEKFINEKLVGKIFHITSDEYLKKIMSDGMIKANAGIDNFPQSKECFAHRKGWIALFDFRLKTKDEIDRAKEDCLCDLLELRNPVVLVVKETCYQKLKYQKEYSQIEFGNDCYVTLDEINGYTRVPYTECWCPGNMSYDAIIEVIKADFPPYPKRVKEMLAKMYEK